MQKAAVLSAIPVPVERLRWLAWTALAVAVYWVVLSYVYVHSVSPINATDSFLYLRIDNEKIAEGALWAAMLSPTIVSAWKRPSDFGLALLYLLGLIPSLILFGLSGQPRDVIYTIIGGYIAVVLGARVPLRIPAIRFRTNRPAALYIAVGSAAFIFLWYLAKGSGNLNFDLSAVYNYRDQANSIFNYGPVSYLATWTFRIMTPYCISYFLFRRKWLACAAALAFQIFSLVIFQEKSVFIPCVMLAALYFLPNGRGAVIGLIGMFVASIVACELIYDLWGNYIPIQLWSKRFFFDQQFLYFNYFDVFSKLGFVYYSDSFLKWLVHYPFPDAPAQMVQYFAMGQLVGDPNTGFLGAGYMELGKAGVILNGLAAGFVLKLFDRVTPRNMPMWFFGTFAFMPLHAMLIAENFVTSLLTGGVGAALLLLMFTRLPGPSAEADVGGL